MKRKNKCIYDNKITVKSKKARHRSSYYERNSGWYNFRVSTYKMGSI